MSDKSIDSEINSLVNQLKDNNTVSKNIDTAKADVPLSRDDVEDFVVENAGKLITQSLEVMESVKDYIMASNDPDSISSLADLIRASSSSIDTLNKMVIQNKRTATTLAAKKMDVEAKYAIEGQKNEHALIASREEMFKKILDQAAVIDVEEEKQDVKDLNSDQ